IHNAPIYRSLDAGEIAEELLTIPLNNKTGVFRALLERGNGTIEDEIPFSIIPEGRFSSAGGHYRADDYILTIAKQLGITWNRDWDNSAATSWYNLQTTNGAPFNWDYSDPIISKYKEADMEILGVLSYHYSWMADVLGTNHAMLVTNAYCLTKWLEYVEETVSHFQNEIKYWEVLNEPYSKWSPSNYIALVDATVPVIKAANPQAVIVGPCGHGYGEWLQGLLDNGLTDLIEVGSFHGYGMNSAAAGAVMDALKGDGKINTIFDSENSAGWGDSFFCQSWQGRSFSGSGTYNKIAETMARSFLLERGEGVNVYFHYWSPTYEAYQNYPSFIGHTGYLKPRGVVFTIANWLTDGYAPIETFVLGDYARCYVFQKGNQRVAVLWDERAGKAFSTATITDPGPGLELLDMMGNPDVRTQQAGGLLSFEFSGAPIYMRMEDDLTAILTNSLISNIGLDRFTACASLASSGEQFGIVLDLYNKDTEAKEGITTLVSVPAGCSPANNQVLFAVAGKESTKPFFPLWQTPESMHNGVFQWQIVASDGIVQNVETVLNFLAAPKAEDVVLDGNLDEWENTPKGYLQTLSQVVAGKRNWQGQQDISGWFSTQWDADYLYVAINVTDDNYIAPPYINWNADVAEIFLDLDLVSDRRASYNNSDEVQLEAGLNNMAEFEFQPNIYDLLQGTGTETANGYQLEIAFPLKEEGMQGYEGFTLGFDVALDDEDASGQGRKLQMMWSGIADNYHNPTKYGQIYFRSSTGSSCPSVIYVDQSNTDGPWDGATWATAFTNIADAITEMSVRNSTVQGGHRILVANGTYKEPVVFTSAHAGTNGAYNVLEGVDYPVIESPDGTSCVRLNLSKFFRLKGFKLTGATASNNGGVTLKSDGPAPQENYTIDDCWIYGNYFGIHRDRHSLQGIVITNCAIFRNNWYGIAFESASVATIANCTIVANGRDGYHGDYANSAISIRDSVIAGNDYYGVSEHTNYLSHAVTLEHCLVYKNAHGDYFDAVAGKLRGAEAINELNDCANNVDGCPGYISMVDFDPTKVYEDSLLVSEGIGIHGLTTYPRSDKTYYVATTGNDANTQEQAQNPETPWQTIQHAADNVVAGDIVRIIPGEYEESVIITNTGAEEFPVQFLAEQGVILDAAGKFGLHLSNAVNVVIGGFEVVGCDQGGSGIRIKQCYGCVVSNVLIHAGTTYNLSGINFVAPCGYNLLTHSEFYGHERQIFFCAGGQAVRNCDVHDGIRGIMNGNISANCEVSNCNIWNHTAYGVFIAAHASTAYYNCNIVSNNQGVFISASASHSLATLWNCNIVGSAQYGIYENASVYNGSESQAYYCNFWGNTTNFYDYDTDTAYVNVADMNAYSLPAGYYANNISVDPKFIDVGNGDFRLQEDSQCIDAGSLTSPLETDYFGNPRLSGNTVDIGSHERQISP
ncbi:MAG: right-handed parallel beta-helix repeat-containing protein, partial [Lentisphaerae bacterium]|nr:right-handed parallel beta-helix repeat-containing protein [Lentisphaerota bacterium]